MSKRTRRDERGAAALEFALVVPLLLMLLIGIVDFGVVFAQNLALGNGARQAARFAAVAGPDCAEVTAEARNNAVSLALSPSDIDSDDVDISGACPGQPCEGSAEGESVRVTITHESEFLVPLPIPGFADTVTLEGEGEFRCEFS